MRAVRARPKKAKRGDLDRTRIVAVALSQLAKEGLKGVSTRRIADALGVAGPSLYWHFKTKRQLLDHMAEAMLVEAQGTSNPLHAERDWRRWLATGGRTIRRAAHSRRDAALVIVGATPTGTQPTLQFDAMIDRLKRVGFRGESARRVLNALARYALGAALAEQAYRQKGPYSNVGFELGLTALIDGFAIRLAHRGKRG